MNDTKYDLIRDLTLNCTITRDQARDILDRLSLDPAFNELINENPSGDSLLGLRVELANAEDEVYRIKGLLSDTVDVARDALTLCEEVVAALDMANEPVTDHRIALESLYRILSKCSA